MMFDVHFVGNSAEPYKMYNAYHVWFVNTSLWLIYINLLPPKTCDSQGTGSRPVPFGVGAYNLQ